MWQNLADLWPLFEDGTRPPIIFDHFVEERRPVKEEEYARHDNYKGTDLSYYMLCRIINVEYFHKTWVNM